MAGNPLIQQGTLNRLRGSVVYANDATLNVTAPYLAREAISIAFEGDAGMLIPTLTGGVTSPEPYQLATITIHLVKSQALANVYKSQIESRRTNDALMRAKELQKNWNSCSMKLSL